ncbi:MAG: hypothetical protein QQW96_20735 [Tychonema bourrellyi B0820]|nr:hypothetical protein [Tychonema bourrellyi B0820]
MGHWAWGIGHGALGMGHWAWGIGHGCQLKVKPIVRQGLKPLSQSESPLKRTEELISPLERTFAIRQGIHSLSDFRLKLTPMPMPNSQFPIPNAPCPIPHAP